MALHRVGRSRKATTKCESEQIQLLAPVLIGVQKVFSIFLSEQFGSVYFIKGDLSVLGDGA